MPEEKMVNKKKIKLETTDITDLEIEAFVYYASEDLRLGSGFGTSISLRGGPSIQKELEEIGGAKLTEAVVSGAGEMKVQYIIHAVGPRFLEEDLQNKLAKTIQNALKAADEKGIARLAMPAMGAGFYGVPLEMSAEVTIDTLSKYLQNASNIQEVVLCMLDSKQYKAFQQRLAKVA